MNRYLIMPLGLSPQVVTETLFLLFKEHKVTVDRIDLIGSVSAISKFQDNQAQVESLYDYWKIDAPLPEIVFHETVQPWDKDMTNRILNNLVQVFKQVREQANQMILCLTAGYKSLSFQSGYAFSFFAGDSDWIIDTHAELSFSKAGHFFPLDTKEVGQLWLNRIDFIPLASLMPIGDIESYQQLLGSAKDFLVPAPIHFVTSEQQVFIGNKQIIFSAAERAFFYWLAQRKKQGLPPINAKEHWAESYLSLYAELLGTHTSYYENTVKTLNDFESSQRYFAERISRVNQLLKKELGTLFSKPYQIQSLGKRPNTRYALTCPQELIIFK